MDINAYLNSVFQAISATIDHVFGPMLHPIFNPINNALIHVYEPWARIFAVGLFISAMIFVFLLKKEYVNLDGPKSIWADLRLWTVLSMVPHLIVYLYF